MPHSEHTHHSLQSSTSVTLTSPFAEFVRRGGSLLRQWGGQEQIRQERERSRGETVSDSQQSVHTPIQPAPRHSCRPTSSSSEHESRQATQHSGHVSEYGKALLLQHDWCLHKSMHTSHPTSLCPSLWCLTATHTYTSPSSTFPTHPALLSLRGSAGSTDIVAATLAEAACAFSSSAIPSLVLLTGGVPLTRGSRGPRPALPASGSMLSVCHSLQQRMLVLRFCAQPLLHAIASCTS